MENEKVKKEHQEKKEDEQGRPSPSANDAYCIFPAICIRKIY